MIKKLIVCFFINIFLFSIKINAENVNNNYSIVFVYLGENLPSYIEESIYQVRTFNKDCKVFILANTCAINKNFVILRSLKKYNVEVVECDKLKKSVEHKCFDEIYNCRDVSGYWRFTTERFFYIHELMIDFDLKDVFQIECDVMVYVNLGDYINLLHNKYKNCIACPFQNEYIASMSITYFYDCVAIKNFVDYICEIQRGKIFEVDMHLLASYKNYTPRGVVEHLPTITKESIRRSVLKNQWGEIAPQPWKYWNHIEEWDSIFDNDGIGSYVEDGKWTFDKAFFDPSLYKIIWEPDKEKRLVPYLCCGDLRGLVPYLKTGDLKYRINTLHIASKRLSKFLSVKK